MTESARLARAWTALEGLALGDALGSQFFVPENIGHYRAAEVPPGEWQWTDDTEMACGLVEHLAAFGEVDQDALIASFAEHHDFDRGYGPSANRLLRLVREGAYWYPLAREAFSGKGSWGNGAAMRVAPLGAYFADELERARDEAVISAEVTHAHPEGVAGAVAVAVAAGIAASGSQTGDDFLKPVIELTPPSQVRDALVHARDLAHLDDPRSAAAVLGNGREISALDTVPFCLWVAARHLGDYRAAFWATARAGGDIDTTCAIVGGIVAARVGRAGLPGDWLSYREPLPGWALAAVAPEVRVMPEPRVMP